MCSRRDQRPATETIRKRDRALADGDGCNRAVAGSVSRSQAVIESDDWDQAIAGSGGWNRISGSRGEPTSIDIGRRLVSPVIGVLVLIVLVVLLATIVAVGASTLSLESSGPTAAFELSADGAESAVTVEHVGGDSVDAEALTVTISVDDEELAAQPPVPFVGANGFGGTPTGPFNAKDDSEWRAGERATLVVAGTNDPELESGDSVSVTLAVDGTRIASLETTAT